MNQAVGKRRDGKPFLMLVLEPGNLTRLQQDRPIKVQVEALFPDGVPKRLELLIAFSATPVEDAREFAEDAEVVLDERTPRSKQIRPHCPECKSTLEQLGMLTHDAVPMATVFCPSCGCSLGMIAWNDRERRSADPNRDR